ncbi:G-type lectin S-receptor-like serine/threonine-protein kinase SD1-13 [Corylus avellana]|uniref:G-type lectin S-receptor-like serine/threonine-protein kinase SD1-13 n=1 Tax=Corylus avellana TaxID=13451 RepID=UPI00286A8E8C|nr:G-type lectin S-receptor-like serine/threonine-protein kinase SD1-13 [Corylus avellana]
MSPECAMEGQFSKKSDVFSFGVLLLEIVSGRRNNSFYDDEHAMNLLGFVNNIVALINPMIRKACFEIDILRCIQVGLLCVQEFAKDRTSVSIVISMPKSEIIDLPLPKQPAFIDKQIAPDADSSQHNLSKCFVNNVTGAMVQG